MKSHTQALLLSSAAWWTLSSFLLVVVRADDTNSSATDVYEGCDLETYYADLLSLGTPDTWTLEQIRDHLTETHRNILPSFPTNEQPDDIVAALIDLWPASAHGTGTDDEIHLIYSNTAIASRPALGLENWRPEQYWPLTRGVSVTSATYTDVHQNAPADYSVLDDKEALNRNFVVFYGECGTVKDAELCVSPANVEAAEDTSQDGKVYTPEANMRGDIARGLFYDNARYVYLTLTDCPPFAQGEYGYRSALLEWHAQDPPDEVEQARNDRACRRWQGNRNIFVDYPQLVPRLFGEPDVILDDQQTYNECVDATEAPTASPNECSAIQPGDISVFGFNSVDPDQILFFPIFNIPAGVGSLFLTTNAWDGEALLPTGKTVEVSVPSACAEFTGNRLALIAFLLFTVRDSG
jgi:endonuclease I